MTRIHLPSSIADAPAASRPFLEGLKKSIGSAPALFRNMAMSPVTLEGTLALSQALGRGVLDAATRERIALAVSQHNGCEYCLSAHAYVGAHVLGLGADEIARNRLGRSSDRTADAALRFAMQLLAARGRVADAVVDEAKAAGLDDAQLIEVVAQVALTTLTNYVSGVARTPLELPPAPPLR